MSGNQKTIATYAAGAGLAAIALIYVFAPTYMIDGDASASGRRRGVVGLVNSANDCFINSVLQALAGLGDLRIYLIREMHRRDLDGEVVYLNIVPDPARKALPRWKIEGLQQGLVTQGLKDILDSLNERPLTRRVVSPTPFVRVLEIAFRQRISRQQQDAQEFLQVVAERLCDEYHAGHRARGARGTAVANENPSGDGEELNGDSLNEQLSQLTVEDANADAVSTPESSESSTSQQGQIEDSSSASLRQPPIPLINYDNEEGFPLEGRSESQIECLTCGFKPKPSGTTFCTLTLNVPQCGSTTLNACFDGMFKTEYIDDFKCERCRLVHAVEIFEHEIQKSTSEKFIVTTQKAIHSLKEAIQKDPEDPPKDVQLPDTKFAPKRKIARHVKITKFPKILAIHLSRSVFDLGRTSQKNAAKVVFTERVTLGGLLEQTGYTLLATVTHKGSHNSGHYESFRRQNIYPPFSNPNLFSKSGVYSKAGTPAVSLATTPKINAAEPKDSDPTTPELLSPTSFQDSPSASLSSSSPSPRDSHLSLSSGRPSSRSGPTSAPRDLTIKMAHEHDSETSSLRSVARSARTGISKTLSKVSTPKDTPKSHITKSDVMSSTSTVKPKPQKRNNDRWWRISDEKAKECKTSDTLGMQKEVYLLFYELVRGDD